MVLSEIYKVSEQNNRKYLRSFTQLFLITFHHVYGDEFLSRNYLLFYNLQ